MAVRCRVIQLSAISLSAISLSCTLTPPSTSSASSSLQRKKIMAKISEKFLKLRFHYSVTICSRDCVVIAKDNSHRLEPPQMLGEPGLLSGLIRCIVVQNVYTKLYIIYISSLPCSPSAASEILQSSMLPQYPDIEGPRFPHPTHKFCMVCMRITCVRMNKDTVILNMIF